MTDEIGVLIARSSLAHYDDALCFCVACHRERLLREKQADEESAETGEWGPF